jgi:ribosome maturation factor RimP
MSTSIDLETVTAVAEPICAAHGVELVLVQAVAERGGVVLRITLDREGSERGPGYGVSSPTARR